MHIYSKVKAAGVAGSIVTILMWVAAQYGVDLPAGVGEALVVIFSFIAGYIKKEHL